MQATLKRTADGLSVTVEGRSRGLFNDTLDAATFARGLMEAGIIDGYRLPSGLLVRDWTPSPPIRAQVTKIA
jgi:hypothetical protein